MRFGFDDAQDLLGRFVLAERVEHHAQQVTSLHARARVPRGAGEPARQREVEREARLLRRDHQEAGVLRVAALEPPHGDPQRVLGRQLTVVLHRVGELAADPLVPAGRQVAPQHFAVQRMGHAHLPGVALGLDVDEGAGFEALDARAVGERADRLEGDGLADAHDLERVALGVVEGAEAHADQLGEAR